MPDLVIWNDKLSASINSMDSQHEQLVSTLNELNAAISEAKGKVTVGDILNRLISYTTSHLHYEETLMLTHDYPGYAMHKQTHDTLVCKLSELRNEYESEKTKMTIEVMISIQNWLTKHIQVTENKVGGFLRSKRIG